MYFGWGIRTNRNIDKLLLVGLRRWWGRRGCWRLLACWGFWIFSKVQGKMRLNNWWKKGLLCLGLGNLLAIRSLWVFIITLNTTFNRIIKILIKPKHLRIWSIYLTKKKFHIKRYTQSSTRITNTLNSRCLIIRFLCRQKMN